MINIKYVAIATFAPLQHQLLLKQGTIKILTNAGYLLECPGIYYNHKLLQAINLEAIDFGDGIKNVN